MSIIRPVPPPGEPAAASCGPHILPLLPEVNGTAHELPTGPSLDTESVNGDWLKLHRCILGSRVFAHEGLFKVWIWCLCRANYKKRSITVTTGTGKMVIDVQPGQFIFGRDSAAKDLDMAPGTVRDRMKKLAEMQNIVLKPDRHCTIVTVCNWGIYQSAGDDARQQPDSQPTTTRQQPDTDKKDKKEKKDKKIPPQPPKGGGGETIFFGKAKIQEGNASYSGRTRYRGVPHRVVDVPPASSGKKETNHAYCRETVFGQARKTRTCPGNRSNHGQRRKQLPRHHHHGQGDQQPS